MLDPAPTQVEVTRQLRSMNDRARVMYWTCIEGLSALADEAEQLEVQLYGTSRQTAGHDGSQR